MALAFSTTATCFDGKNPAKKDDNDDDNAASVGAVGRDVKSGIIFFLWSFTLHATCKYKNQTSK